MKRNDVYQHINDKQSICYYLSNINPDYFRGEAIRDTYMIPGEVDDYHRQQWEYSEKLTKKYKR